MNPGITILDEDTVRRVLGETLDGRLARSFAEPRIEAAIGKAVCR